MKTKKILYLVSEDWIFWSHRLSLAKAALRAGHEVIVATRVTAHGKRIEAAGLKLIPLCLDRKSKNPLHEITLIRQLIGVYKQERPDLVHQITMKPILYGTLAARLAGVGSVVNALTGLGSVFIATGWKAALTRFLLTSCYKWAFGKSNCRVIFQNPDDQRMFISSGLVPQEQTVLIRGSGVDTEKFFPAAAEPPGEPKILFATRMLWDKGIRELVEAARLLKQRGVEGKMLLAGRIDTDNPTAVPEKDLQRWNEEELVCWLGFQEDVAGLLRQCHIAVLPSYREGVPKSLLEAAAAGLPLVATDVPGCREVVDHGKNGYLVPTKDPVNLANALEKLLTDTSLRHKMGVNSRQRAVKEFSDEIITGQTLSLYSGLLNQGDQEEKG